jgi:hypothetical protein
MRPKGVGREGRLRVSQIRRCEIARRCRIAPAAFYAQHRFSPIAGRTSLFTDSRETVVCSGRWRFGRPRCFKKPIKKSPSVCDELPRRRLTLKLRTTRTANPNMNGSPTLGEVLPLAMSFRGHWDDLFRSMRAGRKRFLTFPLSIVKLFRPGQPTPQKWRN